MRGRESFGDRPDDIGAQAERECVRQGRLHGARDCLQRGLLRYRSGAH